MKFIKYIVYPNSEFSQNVTVIVETHFCLYGQNALFSILTNHFVTVKITAEFLLDIANFLLRAHKLHMHS